MCSCSTFILLVGFLTCKTVSRITYTVLMETLNPAQSINHLAKTVEYMAVGILQCRRKAMKFFTGSQTLTLGEGQGHSVSLLFKMTNHPPSVL